MLPFLAPLLGNTLPHRDNGYAGSRSVTGTPWAWHWRYHMTQQVRFMQRIPFRRQVLGGMAWVGFFATSIALGEDPLPQSPLVGRWDLTVQGKEGEYPSWLEIRLSGYRTLVGSFVGQFGSARPISKIEVTGNRFRFTIPPQWEKRSDDQVVEGELDHDRLTGDTNDEHGKTIRFVGVRAPALPGRIVPKWSEPIALFNGRDLSGWKPLLNKPNGWEVRDGILTNAKPGNNLATEQTFTDFQLHVEFRYPAKSNSGIYLRGRHEVQIEDNFGEDPNSLKIGGVYGFLTPSVNASKPAGEWQTYDITLVGRVVTVHLNGERIIDRQTIPGITGGAIDSHEGEPGPLYLQGDHGPVEFRKITLALPQ